MDDHVGAQLDRCYGGRDWIVAADFVQAATPLIVALRAHGAGRAMVVAGVSGIGPAPDDVPVVLLGTSGSSLMAAIRAFERALGQLGPEARAAVDTFDPDGTARVIGSLFTAHERVADRPVYGARHVSWRLLEDKTVVDAVWDAAGVPRAPSAVVDVDRAALVTASRSLDAGHGVVWAGDNREGWHGGATGLRWIRDEGDVDAALDDLRSVADRARVMPFLDGVPCSIHGMVFPDVTVALRPCEMVVLRQPGRADLRYAGTATTWDPPPARRDELRAIAMAVGEHLRAAVGYRGVFSVDGVMTADGFRPTELNPRFGAAANLIAAAAEVPLYLIHLAVVAGEPVDWRPVQLVTGLVDAADRTRTARSFVTVPDPLPEADVGLAWHGAELRPVAADQPVDVTVRAGSGPVGGSVMVQLVADRYPAGRSAAPAVAAALRWADVEWGLGVGPVEAAPDVAAAGT